MARSLLRAGALVSLTVTSLALLHCGEGDGRQRVDGATNGSGHGNVNGDDGSHGPDLSGTGASGSLVPGTNNSQPDACQEFEIHFEPKIPTVYILVDQSGSMFAPQHNFWEPLKAGVLQVVGALQEDIRFGFAAFGGEFQGNNPDLCQPPLRGQVPIALNNLQSIEGAYNSLSAPEKGETPSAAAIHDATELLLQDDSPGERYILFVTDGEPDFCDDGNSVCPIDATIREFQASYSAGISSFIFGLPHPDVNPLTLQRMANAGSGQPVQDQFDDPNRLVYYDCQGVEPWLALHSASGKAALEPLAEYAPVGGTAPVFTPDPADAEALVQELSSVLSGVKSCTFDLEGEIAVNTNLLDRAGVQIEGEAVPLNDGWRMNGDTQVELVGDYCQKWRHPDSINIRFEFPCDIIVVR